MKGLTGDASGRKIEYATLISAIAEAIPEYDMAAHVGPELDLPGIALGGLGIFLCELVHEGGSPELIRRCFDFLEELSRCDSDVQNALQVNVLENLGEDELCFRMAMELWSLPARFLLIRVASGWILDCRQLENLLSQLVSGSEDSASDEQSRRRLGENLVLVFRDLESAYQRTMRKVMLRWREGADEAKRSASTAFQESLDEVRDR